MDMKCLFLTFSQGVMDERLKEIQRLLDKTVEGIVSVYFFFPLGDGVGVAQFLLAVEVFFLIYLTFFSYVSKFLFIHILFCKLNFSSRC